MLWSTSLFHLISLSSYFFHCYGKPNGKLKLLPHFSRPASNDTILNRLCKVYAEKRNEEVMKVGFWSEFCATVGTVPASCKYWVHAFPSLNRDVRWFRSDYIQIRMKRSHSSPDQCPMICRPWHRWQKKQQRAAKMRRTWCRYSAMCPWIPYTHRDDITSPIWFLC